MPLIEVVVNKSNPSRLLRDLPPGTLVEQKGGPCVIIQGESACEVKAIRLQDLAVLTWTANSFTQAEPKGRVTKITVDVEPLP